MYSICELHLRKRLTSAQPTLFSLAATRQPLRAQVRAAVLRMLEDDSFAHTRVRDTSLAALLGVSRTPVREALLDLARAGVLVSDHGRGFRPAPLEAREIRDLGQILAALEALALGTTPPFTPSQLDELERGIVAIDAARGDARLLLDRNEAWHSALHGQHANRRLRERLAELRGAMRRYVLAYLKGAGRLGLATGGHRRVLTSLRAGDRAAAARALGEQLLSGTDELASWLERAAQVEGSSRSSGSR